jgi:hypothetical protein
MLDLDKTAKSEAIWAAYLREQPTASDFALVFLLASMNNKRRTRAVFAQWTVPER